MRLPLKGRHLHRLEGLHDAQPDRGAHERLVQVRDSDHAPPGFDDDIDLPGAAGSAELAAG